MSIVIRDVSKNFGDFKVLQEINLEIKEGSLVALLGPSGSGKSTLLRAIAGLQPPDTGKIIIYGEDMTYLDVKKRNIGFVFQHYALFKEMTVRDNIAFGLDIRKAPRSQIKQRVDELLALIKLEGLGDRYPDQLSGGQRQRVALARALAVQPKVLLLDEPFGALDAKIRKELRVWVRQLHEEFPVTTVFVTHDQEEAMEVADEIVIMNQGKIEQVGTTAQIYDNPASAFVIKFIGAVNVFSSQASLLKSHQFDSVSNPVFVRPHRIQIFTELQEDSTAATIQRIIYLGWEIQIGLIDGDGLEFEVHLNRHQLEDLDLKVGQKVFVKALETRLFSEVA
jgi:sulfate transport system ATP-binding protein